MNYKNLPKYALMACLAVAGCSNEQPKRESKTYSMGSKRLEQELGFPIYICDINGDNNPDGLRLGQNKWLYLAPEWMKIGDTDSKRMHDGMRFTLRGITEGINKLEKTLEQLENENTTNIPTN